ncbi:DUF261 family protein [Borrelia miyamotoi]
MLNPFKIFRYYGINADVYWENNNYKCLESEFEIS